MEILKKETTTKMEKALEALKREFVKLRTGRASLAILDDVRVDYYNQLVPLNQVATLGVPESRLITIAPWEQKMIPVIEKAIEKANIGINPANDGKIIRLPIPPLNEERRKELVKMIKHHGEETKVSIRHVRRESLDVLKKMEKDGDVSQDESKKESAQMQKLTDEFVAKVDEVIQHKEKEIMQV